MLNKAFYIVKKSLKHYVFSTVLTAISVSLAAGLLMSVFVIQAQSQSVFTGGPFGFDAVLGARGSQLQLVLNSVFHLDVSPGNIPWNLYTHVKKDKRVKLAVPYAVGDNYYGYRIVGTSDEIFTEFEFRPGEKFRFAEGRAFNQENWETVIGSYAAQELGLKVGDTIHPYHGFIFDPKAKHEESYKVVGILEPTNTPSDKVVWIPIDIFYRVEGHVLRGDGEEYWPEANKAIPDKHKEVSAVMLKLKSMHSGIHLDRMINKQGKVATLAWPIGGIMTQLFDKIGWISKVLGIIAYLVVFVSIGSILSSVYNTINERKREFAILRALGAKKRIVFTSIILECSAIAGLGAVLGYGIYFIILSVTSAIIRSTTGVFIDVLYFHPVLIWTPIGMIILGAIAGILPASKAYSTDVATNIVPTT